MVPNSIADKPDEARTDNSAASSISCLMDLTERKTPGSIGGGVALPGLDGGNGVGNGEVENVLRGESGGEKSPNPWKQRSRCLLAQILEEVGGSNGRRVSATVRMAGSRLRLRRESRSSTGSCNQGPWQKVELVYVALQNIRTW